MSKILIDRSTVKQTLEALDAATSCIDGYYVPRGKTTLPEIEEAQKALRTALAQQDESEAYGYASRLAVAIWEKNYKDIAPQWKPLNYLIGVLTQIDNMTSGLTRQAQQAEKVEPAAESTYHPCTFILIEGLKKLKAWDVLSEWDKAREIVDKRFRTALAQQDEPVQEPVAWLAPDGSIRKTPAAKSFREWAWGRNDFRPLYTAPPQRKPLTKEQFLYIYNQLPNWGMDMDSLPQGLEKFGREVELAHGIGEQP